VSQVICVSLLEGSALFMSALLLWNDRGTGFRSADVEMQWAGGRLAVSRGGWERWDSYLSTYVLPLRSQGFGMVSGGDQTGFQELLGWVGGEGRECACLCKYTIGRAGERPRQSHDMVNNPRVQVSHGLRVCLRMTQPVTEACGVDPTTLSVISS
jgi:hypothetical protein